MSDLPDNDAMEAAIAQWAINATGLAVGQVMWSGKPRPTGTYIQLSIPVDDGVDWGEDASEWNPLVVPDQTIVSVSGNQLAIPAHPYQNADGPFRIAGTGIPPLPIVSATNVWTIIDDAGHVRLASSYLNARRSVPITLTSSGSGTLKLVASNATLRTGQEVLHHVRTLHKLTLRCVCFSTVNTGSGTARSVLRKLVTRGALPTVWKTLVDAGLGWAGHTNIQTIDGVAGNSPNSMTFEPRAIVSIDMFYRGDVSEYGTIIQSADITSTRTGHTFHVPKS